MTKIKGLEALGGASAIVVASVVLGSVDEGLYVGWDIALAASAAFLFLGSGVLMLYRSFGPVARRREPVSRSFGAAAE